MVAGNSGADGISLRQALRERTRALHDRLDAAISPAAMRDDDAYAAFLAVQFAARAPIERWAKEHVASELTPPATAQLIAADLATLSAGFPLEAHFSFPAGADPRGLAWALGGSALGNKAMLVRRRRAGRDNADQFLSDKRTGDFFRGLMPTFAQPVTDAEADAAVAAAEAVFRTFLAAADDASLKAAA